MTIKSSRASAFASPSPCFSSEISSFLDKLELLKKDTTEFVLMRTGRAQLENYMKREWKGPETSFEDRIDRDSVQWETHLTIAREEKDVRVKKRLIQSSELIPGLKGVYDIQVGRAGRPDDNVYFKSAYAREWLPRGNCIAEWQIQERRYYFPLIRGYRKFTGQEDDGELLNETENRIEKKVVSFFSRPKTQSKWVIATSKENGEAGHLAVLKRSDGEFVYVLGSKNTHLLAQTVEDIERTRVNQQQTDKSDPYCAARPIATAILRKVFGLVPVHRKLLCEFLWQTRATASFEVLCPSHQHVQLLDNLDEDTPVFYGLSLMTLNCVEGAEICVNPVLLYEFMGALGVRTVTYKVFDYNADAFKAELELSKSAFQHEGVVHLFTDANAAVIGMQKHKSIWYVCLRAIREKAKSFCRTLRSFEPPKDSAKPRTHSPEEALRTARKSMQKRFTAITGFMQISDEVANNYEKLGEQFLEYLFENELFRGVAANKDEEEKCKKIAKDVANLFPIVWKRFLDHTGLNDAISNTHKQNLLKLSYNLPRK
ncbi:unnamed protein product [Peronospora belbahrii]|uniref:DUF7920 domain-containing protein n=1 Tax=Peronospora belbahrii TaxID=622444 RepID=A0ABN8CX53_9STRA|nr:unnamed protein product [Peronospora belbahrii]